MLLKLKLLKITLVLLLLTAFFFSHISAQTVKGEWYGVGQVKKAGDHNSYLSEMILKQKGTKVTGEFNYYFRSVLIKTKITGTYSAKFRLLELNARPVLNFQAKNANGADCPMEGSFTLKVSKAKTTLTGQFNPIYEYRYTCPAINITFVKSVNPSTNPVHEEPDEDPVAVPKIVTKVKKATLPDPNEKIISALNQRAFETSPVIDVDADSLKVTLYDNGEVDNDTISVFYNRKLIKYKQMLSDKPYTFSVPLDTSVNEISMFAENLGRIPPNTALAIIYAGEQRFELNLSSTYSKNAAIRFRRKIKHVDPKNIN